MPFERSATLRAEELPLSKLDLTRWTKHPRRLACPHGLECARSDVDVDDRDHLRRWLRLHGELDPGGPVPGTVPFDVELALKR
jgi:hypothetical protein